MIKNSKIFYIGIFIFLIPFLGLPSSGKTFLTVVMGLVLVFLSVNITLPKRPVKKVRTKKEKSGTTTIEYIPTEKSDDILPTQTSTDELSNLS